VLPFLVYRTGCGSLEITATLKGVPPAKLKMATLKKSVPFECGEQREFDQTLMITAVVQMG
jgi:hypothetical protein